MQPEGIDFDQLQFELDEGSDHESDEGRTDIGEQHMLYRFNVQVLSASELATPNYRFGDITRKVFGTSRLDKVYAELQLGKQTEKTSRAERKSRSFFFPSEQLNFLHRGEEQLGVRIRDSRGMQPGGDPLVGEGLLHLSGDHRDGKQHNQVVDLQPSGQLKILLDMQALSAEQECDALASATSAKFCNLSTLPPWKEEFASLPHFDSYERRKVVKFGQTKTVNPDETKEAAVGKYKKCILVMQAGVPDSWKDFAWYHCSGAAALSKKLGKDSSTLARWYDNLMSATFGDEFLPQVFAAGVDGQAPLFNQGMTHVGGCNLVLEEEWPHLVNMLTPDGVNKAKRILWTLSAKWSAHADFCPWIPPVVLAILTFSAEHETCAALHCLLRRSWRNIKTLPKEGALARIFLFCTREQFCRVVQQFVAIMQRSGGPPKDILEQLRSKGIDVHAFIANLLSDCLASVLPARAFLRLLGSVLIAGWKAAARYLGALLQVLTTFSFHDLANSDAASVERLVRQHLVEHAKTLTGSKLDEFVCAAFKPDMQSRHAPYAKFEAELTGLDYCSAAQFAWPRGAMSSLLDPEILNSLDLASLISLWSGPLPLLVRDRRLKLVFTPAKHGWRLDTLVSCCAKTQEEFGEKLPMLLLVMPSPDLVLGMYSPCLLQRTSGDGYVEQEPGVRFDESFVFMAKRAPEREAHRIDPTREHRALTLQEYILEHKGDCLDDDQLRAGWGALELDMKVITRSSLKHFFWTDANKMLFHLGSKKLLFGGPAPAISFNESLDQCTSHFCATFGSPPLRDVGLPGVGKCVRVGSRRGKITIEDDSELPFKVLFDDGQVPEADWVKRSDAELLEIAEERTEPEDEESNIFTFHPRCLEVFAFVDN